MADTATPARGTRGSNKLLRQFSADGETYFPRVCRDVAHLRLISVESNHVMDVDIAAIPEHIQKMAIAFGLNTRIGNEAAGAEDEDEAITAMEECIERLITGDWTEARQGGPRSGDMVAAYERVYKDAGAELPAPVRERLIKELSEGTRTPKACLKDPRVAAAHAAIKAERQAKRLADLRSKADAADEAALPE